MASVIPIISFSNKEQYLVNMEAANIQLSDEQMAFLNAAGG
jgi:aryl-alcohol dehydrogenase-like predicted oxidoreductase